MPNTAEIVQRLHRVWRQRTDLESQLSRGPKQIAHAQLQTETASQALKHHRELIKNKRMEADRKQLQMREREAKLYDIEVKMNMSKGEREYQTLKSQIAADKQANSVLADEILETLEEIDRLESQTQEFIDREAKSKQDLVQVDGKVTEAKSKLEADLKLVMEELTAAEKNLTGELRTAYDRLSTTMRDDAIAALEDGTSCGGCYTQLSPRILDQMDMKEAIRCTSCGRLVYRPN
jgi:predicted  nucleic acid-binding Zn-ribbon protein